MAGQNPFVYNPGAHEAAISRYSDPREGWWSDRRFRKTDIDLPPGPGPIPMPTPPPAPSILRAGGPIPPQMPDVRELDNQMPQSRGNYALMGGGSREQTRGALAGLAAAQSQQFSPFSEFDLAQMASRDPNMVKPGSNQVWQRRLTEMQDNRAAAEKFQREQNRGIEGAISSLHPAVQEVMKQKAMAESLPSRITAQGQIKAAQIGASGRIGAANAAAGARYQGDRQGTLDSVMRAIQVLKQKNNFTNQDAEVLRGLMQVYNDQAAALGIAGFEGLDDEE